MTKQNRREDDELKIVFRGTEKFRQKFIDRIYELLMDEDFQMDCTKPGCGFDLECTIGPSDDVM